MAGQGGIVVQKFGDALVRGVLAGQDDQLHVPLQGGEVVHRSVADGVETVVRDVPLHQVRGQLPHHQVDHHGDGQHHRSGSGGGDPLPALEDLHGEEDEDGRHGQIEQQSPQIEHAVIGEVVQHALEVEAGEELGQGVGEKGHQIGPQVEDQQRGKGAHGGDDLALGEGGDEHAYGDVHAAHAEEGQDSGVVRRQSGGAVHGDDERAETDQQDGDQQHGDHGQIFAQDDAGEGDGGGEQQLVGLAPPSSAMERMVRMGTATMKMMVQLSRT